MKKNNKLYLTESEFKNLIKESVKRILSESNKMPLIRESHNFSVDWYDIDTSDYPDLEEYLEDAELPDTISVDITFDEDEGDPGDYWTAPVHPSATIEDLDIDVNGAFRKIMPSDLYSKFISCVSDSIYRNSSDYEEQRLNDMKDEQYDYIDYDDNDDLYYDE